MNYQTYIPSEDLTAIVRQYWTLEGNTTDRNGYVHRTTANFCPELIFHYGGRFKEIIQDNVVETTFMTGIHGQTDLHFIVPYALVFTFMCRQRNCCC